MWSLRSCHEVLARGRERAVICLHWTVIMHMFVCMYAYLEAAGLQECAEEGPRLWALHNGWIRCSEQNGPSWTHFKMPRTLLFIQRAGRTSGAAAGGRGTGTTHRHLSCAQVPPRSMFTYTGQEHKLRKDPDFLFGFCFVLILIINKSLFGAIYFLYSEFCFCCFFLNWKSQVSYKS